MRCYIVKRHNEPAHKAGFLLPLCRAAVRDSTLKANQFQGSARAKVHMTRTTETPVKLDFLLQDVATTGAGKAINGAPAKKTFNAELVGTGANAVVDIEGSNIGTAGSYKAFATITLSSASPSDALFFDAPYVYTRANVKSISGTNAKVSCAMGS